MTTEPKEAQLEALEYAANMLTSHGGNFAKRASYAAALRELRDSMAKPALAVWYGPMPESNGKSNFTAILGHKGNIYDGFTIARSEYPERVRYDADCVRFLIGELDKRPCILDYDGDKHSGYVEPKAQPAQGAVPVALPHSHLIRIDTVTNTVRVEWDLDKAGKEKLSRLVAFDGSVAGMLAAIEESKAAGSLVTDTVNAAVLTARANPSLPADGGREVGWDITPDDMVQVTRHDANQYCRILRVLGMEEEGDAVAEVKRLLALDKRADDVGAAIQRACGKLPEGWNILIDLENGAASVELQSPEGETVIHDGDGDSSLADIINEWIDDAIRSDAMLAASREEKP